MHGGASTGPKTAAGLTAIRKIHMKHGNRTKESMEFRRILAKELVEASRQSVTCQKMFRGESLMEE